MKILKRVEMTIGVSSVVFGLASLFSIPFGDELFILIMGLGTLFYMIGGVFLYKYNKEDNSGNKFMKIVCSFYAGNAFAVCLGGILYKLMLWPFNHQMMIVGLMSIVLFFVIIMILWLLNRSKYTFDLLKTNIIFLVITSLVYFTPLDRFIDIRYRSYPRCAELFKQAHKADDSAKWKEARDCMRNK